MTTVFRRKIAQRIFSTIEDSICKSSVSHDADSISPLLKMNRFGRNVPQLLLPWHKLEKLNPVLEECNPTTLLKALRNQGLPNTDGVTNISFDNNQPRSIVFTLDGDIFNKAVLMDLYVNLDVITFKSCNFQNIIPKTVLIEHSCPKLGKCFDMSYFRSAILSNFIANINKFVGHKVIHLNCIEDGGLPWALLVAGYEVFGIEDELEKNPNFHLSAVLKAAFVKCHSDCIFYEKAELYYKKMTEGDMEVLSISKKLRDACLKEFKRTYKLLGIEFDEIHCDSMYSSEIMGIEKELIEKQLMSTQQDSSGGNISPDEDYVSSSQSVAKNFYSPAYSVARNIAAALYRKNMYNFDEMYCVANASEKKHFSLLSDMLQAMGHDWYRDVHHVRLQDFRLSKTSRKAPLFAEVFQHSKIAVLKNINQNLGFESDVNTEDIGGILATSSLIVDALNHRKSHDYLFDHSNVTRITKNTGLYLQICHATLTQLLEESEIKVKFDTNISSLTHAEALSLIRHLSRFEEIIFKAYYTLEPCVILQYLDTLRYHIDKALAVLPISLKEDRLTVVKARLLLFQVAKKVLHKGLQLVGLKPLERSGL